MRVDLVAFCTFPQASQKYRPWPLSVSLRTNAARHCCKVTSPFGPSPCSGSVDGESGVDGTDPFLLMTGGIGSDKSINGSLRSFVFSHFMQVMRVMETPPNMSIILSLEAVSLVFFVTTGVLGREEFLAPRIVSSSCFFTSLAVTPRESREGDAKLLVGELKCVTAPDAPLALPIPPPSSSRRRLDLHGRHAQPILCRFAPQRDTMTNPPSSSPASSTPRRFTRPFTGVAPPAIASRILVDASSSPSSSLKKLGLGLERPLRLRTLRALVGGFGIPSADGECSFCLGVTTPRISTACRPPLSSFLSLSNKNRINSCASCCSFPAKAGTNFHTLFNKSHGGNASYRPLSSVLNTARSSPPTFSVSALAMSALRSLVIAGGRIANRLFPPPPPSSPALDDEDDDPRFLPPLDASPPSPPPRFFRFRTKSSNFKISSRGSIDRAVAPSLLPPFAGPAGRRRDSRTNRAERHSAASSPRM